MRCRCAVIAAVGLVACSAVDVPVTDASGPAGRQIILSVADLNGTPRIYHFEIEDAPAGSTAYPPTDGEVCVFTPDREGGYLIDVELAEGIANDLVARFAITVTDSPPVAQIAVGSATAVGTMVTADGTSSTTAAGPLQFHWRLAARPLASAATLGSDGKPTATFEADVAGDYQLELDVFDGQLWDVAPATATITAGS